MQKTAASQPEPAPAPPPTVVDGQVLARMHILSARPPQSLVMEGASAAGRMAAALAWAKALNCADRDSGGCKTCMTCRQIDERAYRDLIVVDRQFFEDDPKTANIDQIRALLPVWGQPPHGAGQRVTIFAEAQDLHPSAANLLLKTLEEPRPGNVFVLLAPQRERLLQTLVSRSFVLTLPWPESAPPEADAAEWIAALLRFWDSGQGWFERTGTKGAADRGLALRILSGLSRELAFALALPPADAQPGDSRPGNVPAQRQESSTARRLARLGPAGLRRLDLVLATAQEALTQPTAPVALVLDWLATAVIPKPAPRAPRRD
ncbi:DNA polymerase III subunit delta' [Humidesulfovibrio sp.]